MPKAVGKTGKDEDVEDGVPVRAINLAPDIRRRVVDRSCRRSARRKRMLWF
jgi:hypothetical protein